jgi:phosphoribosylformylglycinamidine cyclo-ligase
MAHITGGGFIENIPRMFNGKNLCARVQLGSWRIPPVFDELSRLGADKNSLYNTFNMGIGFVLAADAARADDVLAAFNAAGCEAFKIGAVAAGSGGIELVQA